MINLIECLDQVGMLFLSDLSRQNVPRTQVNRDSTFQIHQRVTEKRKGFSQTTNTDGDRSPDVSDTRSHCFQSTRERSQIVRTSRVRGEIKSRTSPNTRRNHTMCLALHRVRGGQVSYFSEYADRTKQRILHSSKCSDKNSHCSECADRDLFLAEFTKRGRCDIPLVTQHQGG